MTAPPAPPSLAYRAALRLAALRVPAPQRAEWLAEWSAELWHVSAAVSAQTLPSLDHHRSIAAFCHGALADARCLRALEARSPAPPLSGSAARCAASLFLTGLLAAVLSVMLPGVRSATIPIFGSEADRTVTIWPAGFVETGSPTLPLRTVRAWQRRSQHLFTAFAFYQPVRKTLHIDASHASELVLARGSANLLSLLGVPVEHAVTPPAGDTTPRLFLSESTWRSRFGARPEIFGRALRVGLDTVRLAGVVPDRSNPAGGRVEAWLLLPDSLAQSIPDNARIFALGRMAPESDSALPSQPLWHFSVPNADDDSTDFTCVTLSAHDPHPWHSFCFIAALALLSLPAITSVSLGDYTRQPMQIASAVAPRRWLFLLVKVAAILPAAWFISLDLAYGFRFASADTPQYILSASTFVIVLFGLQWALRDQRRRCPTCLRALSCPARVGQPSRNFLAWNGTELICSGGHGLLHVPELPTSWFSHPRWLALDPSWSSLFFRAA